MLELYGKPLEEIPIKEPDKETASYLSMLVDKVISASEEIAPLLAEIDNAIYSLYGLSDKEIEITENYSM